jgi:hypothetical protein
MGTSYGDMVCRPSDMGRVLRMRNKLSGCVLKNYVKTRDGADASGRHCSSLSLKRSCKFAIASRTDSSACCRWCAPSSGLSCNTASISRCCARRRAISFLMHVAWEREWRPRPQPSGCHNEFRVRG